jgi:8-oxo-dGTP pyrophosphatase MutT (NUDIX family)
VAAREALEEAGLIGKIVGKRSIGSYHYSKQLSEDRSLLCRVKVFLLSVDRQLDIWPEMEQRDWRWVDPTRAAQMVDEGGLAEILRSAFPAVQLLSPKAAKQKRLPR